jgi:hypothetical protein
VRAIIFRGIVFLLALSGCAYEGAIVNKVARPLPFEDSLGLDAIYKFELRDRNGEVHSQMVTPWVFTHYQVGDYFSDFQPLPWHWRFSPEPQPLGEGVRRQLQDYETPYRPLQRNGVAPAEPNESQ